MRFTAQLHTQRETHVRVALGSVPGTKMRFHILEQVENIALDFSYWWMGDWLRWPCVL